MRKPWKPLSVFLTLLMLVTVMSPAGLAEANAGHVHTPAPIADDSQTAAAPGTAALFEKRIPAGFHKTGLSVTDENGRQIFYLEGKASEYGYVPYLWVDAEGFALPPEEQPFVTYEANAGAGQTFPSSYDARDDGLITPVERQIGGTCWAHAAAAVMEANAIKQGLATADSVNISEYQLLWYGYNGYYAGVTESRNDGMTGQSTYDILERGGNPTVIGYAVLNHQGPALESRYDLDESLNETAFAAAMEEAFLYDNRFERDFSFESIHTYSAEPAAIKAALTEFGAVQISYFSGGYYTKQNNLGDELCAYYCPIPQGINHAVTVVGWDDDFSRENFREDARPIHNGAWLVKNSWGANWGNDGYFWLSYEDATIAQVATYKVAPLTDRENAYSHNGMICLNAVSCTAAGNVFTTKAREHLTYVTPGETLSGAYTFKIYGNVPANAASPEEGTLLYTQTGETANELWIPVNDLVLLDAGERFSVVFEGLSSVMAEGTGRPAGFATSGNVVYTGNPGESFVKQNGAWKDAYALGKNNVAVAAFSADEGTAPYAVTFICPGHFTQTVTADANGTVALPQTPGHTWVFTYMGGPFDGANVTRNMTVNAHCYPTAGAINPDSACETVFRCVYCGKDMKDPVAEHTEVPTVVAPTREHPGYTDYTCSICGAVRRTDWTIHPDGDGQILGDFIWQYYDGAISFAGTGRAPDFSGQSAAKPWGSHAGETVDFYMGEGLTHLGSFSFCYFNQLKNIVYPSTIRSIGNSAFMYCKGLEEVTVPAGLIDIGTIDGDTIYYGCSGIRRIVIEEGIRTLNNAFYKSYEGAEGLEVVIPSTLISYHYLCHWYYIATLERYVVSPDNPHLKAVDGVLFSKDGTKIISYPPSKPGAYYKPPAGVTGLDYYSFSDLRNLKYLDLSETAVTVTGNYQFAYAKSLTNVNLPANLVTMAIGLLHNASGNLKKLFVPSSLRSARDPKTATALTFYSATALSALQNLTAANVTYTVLEGHEHAFTEVAEEIPATCQAAGQVIRVCECGQFEAEATPLSEHSFEWINDTDPDCGHDGSRHQVCSVCGATGVTETIPATGEHSFTWIVDSEPDCGHDGARHQVCSVCGTTGANETIPANGEHTFTWVVDTEPDCGHDGSRHQVCSRCGATGATEVIPATGEHSFTWVNDTEPDCIHDGSRHQVCSRCGAIGATEVIPATGEHSFTWVNDTDPDCIHDGSRHQVCSRCGAIGATEILPATGEHIYTREVVGVETLAYPADCENAARYYYTCEHCSSVERNGSRTFASGGPIGHSYVLTDETDSTCQSAGKKIFTCEHCGESKVETKPLADHTPETVPGRAATCTQTGLTDGVRCSACKTILTQQQVLPKTAHSYGAWSTETDATCTRTGVSARYCTVCGDRQTDMLPKTAHTDRNDDGFCDDCGAELKSHGDRCPLCGETHTGFWGSIVGFFHRIVYFFKHLFGG